MNDDQKVLIIVPPNQRHSARGQIRRVQWIFDIDKPFEVMTIDEFTRTFGDSGWDAPEFRQHLLDAGYGGLTSYGRINKKTYDTVQAIIQGIAKGTERIVREKA